MRNPVRDTALSLPRISIRDEGLHSQRRSHPRRSRVILLRYNGRVPDKRSHRGPHPEDARLFAADQWPALRAAVDDLSWLLSHDYALHWALKLVGDRYQLDERQRRAVMRSTCSEQSLAWRRGNELMPAQVAGRKILLDGYNVLTTVEAARRGVLLRRMDGCLRIWRRCMGITSGWRRRRPLWS